jgi:hypothetical protein
MTEGDRRRLRVAWASYVLALRTHRSMEAVFLGWLLDVRCRRDWHLQRHAHWIRWETGSTERRPS